jgi:hypothetical protein
MDQKVSPKVLLDQSIDEKVSPKVSLDRKCHEHGLPINKSSTVAEKLVLKVSIGAMTVQ